MASGHGPRQAYSPLPARHTQRGKNVSPILLFFPLPFVPEACNSSDYSRAFRPSPYATRALDCRLFRADMSHSLKDSNSAPAEGWWVSL